MISGFDVTLENFFQSFKRQTHKQFVENIKNTSK